MSLLSKPTARALTILDLLMANPQKGIGLTEITRKLGLNKATCHAILSTLATSGYLVQHPKTKAYWLGPSIIAAGNAAFAQFPVLEYARPALEALKNDLGLGFAVFGRSAAHVVLLALYGNASPLIDQFPLGLRVPYAAPLGAGFIAWAPPKSLEAWLSAAHEARGKYDEELDQSLRMAAIGIHSRGFEVLLKTPAERELINQLQHLHNAWNRSDLDKIINKYHLSLCEDSTHLNRIDPQAHYEVSAINVPVFAYMDSPILNFAAGSFPGPVTGAEIKQIAKRLLKAAKQVSKVAQSQGHPEWDADR